MKIPGSTRPPRIHGELLKLGIDIGQTSVAKYMAKRRDPPSQGWRTFLRNHADGIAAMDLFVVPTISFRLLYGLLIVGHGRRQILWFGVTAHPTADWIANQITEACGWEQAPRYLIRDRDGAYGEVFIRRLRSIGIRDRPTSPRSPWQNGYAERLIGSIRRECLDHVLVFSERHLRHLLLCYMKYYNGTRTHLSLEKDAPVSRAVDRAGHILCRPILGGLHHHYVRVFGTHRPRPMLRSAPKSGVPSSRAITASPSIRNDCALMRSAASTIAGIGRPVVTIAGEAADARAIPAHHQPVAVVLDFVDPERAGRWPRHLRRQARFDESGGTPPLVDHGRRIEQWLQPRYWPCSISRRACRRVVGLPCGSNGSRQEALR
ncbi:Integrase core domain-containing protein [Bradyrhizobium erythrophlei]|nr:Integrase core domain-containing protein [Bradyrhizobium erythrophlei]